MCTLQEQQISFEAKNAVNSSTCNVGVMHRMIYACNDNRCAILDKCAINVALVMMGARGPGFAGGRGGGACLRHRVSVGPLKHGHSICQRFL